MNNRQNGRRRGRNGGQPPRNGQTGGADRGSRIDNRARGNASQLYEKYKALARDSQMQGDRVTTEYYHQFADHYFRVLNESRARFEEQRPRRDEFAEGDGNRDDYAGDDQDEGFDGDDGGQDQPPPQPQRRDYARDNQGRDGQARDGQQRDNSPRDNQQRDTQQRDGQRDTRDRDHRPRENGQPRDQQARPQQRDDQPREDRRPRRDSGDQPREGGQRDTPQRDGTQRDASQREPISREQPARSSQPREERAPDEAPRQPELPIAAVADHASVEPRAERRPRRPRIAAEGAAAQAVPAGDGGTPEPKRIEIDRLPPAFATEVRTDPSAQADHGATGGDAPAGGGDDGAVEKPRRRVVRRPRADPAAAADV